MTIIATTAAPLRPRALTNGVEDIVAEAFVVSNEVQQLASLGVQVSLTVDPGTITADLTVNRATAGLLPGLVGELENANVTYAPQTVLITGTMCQGAVTARITVDRAHLTIGYLQDVIDTIDLDSLSPADAMYTERVA